MLLVEFKQFHNMAKTFDLVLKTFINHNVNVELFVAPVDLENRLEASQEWFSFNKCTFNDFLYTSLSRFESISITDPGNWIKSKRFGLFPFFSYDVIPLF